MAHLQIDIEENDLSWRERCNFRIEGLKNAQFSSSDSPSPLLQEKISVEKKLMSYELYQSVENQNADEFVVQLERTVTERRLCLSDIGVQVTQDGDSLLHVAAHFGADNIADLICIHFPELLTKRNSEGNTALHVAARAKNPNVVQLILSRYAAQKEEFRRKGKAESSSELEDNEPTTMTNENGDTPLHEAVYSDDNFETVSFLLQADNSVARHLNTSGKSPLYIAVQTSHQSRGVVDLLLKATFVDSPLPRGHGISPLHAAISEKNLDLLIHILEKKVEVMYLRDEDGGTPLHYAASNGYLEGVRQLLHRSIQLALERNTNGLAPIHVACKMGHVEVVQEFLKLKWPNVRAMLTPQGQNILHIAVENGRRNVVEYLLSHKDRFYKFLINGKDKEGHTALHLASMRSDHEILIHILRDKRVDQNIKNTLPVKDIDDGLNNEAFSRPSQSRGDPLLRCSASKQNGSKSAGAPIPNESPDEIQIDDNVDTAMVGSKSAGPSKQNGSKSAGIDENVDTAMVVAALIVTVTFTAGVTVPGGVYSTDKPGSEFGGLAVLAHRAMFKMFIICNTIAMYTSTYGCVCLISVRFTKLRLPMMGLTPDLILIFGLESVGWALVTMSLAFTAATHLLVCHESSLANIVTSIGGVYTFSLGWMYCVSFGSLISTRITDIKRSILDLVDKVKRLY